MCAMALLHSRISRLIYMIPHPAGWGGCNPDVSLHQLDRLNHSFEVFTFTAN